MCWRMSSHSLWYWGWFVCVCVVGVCVCARVKLFVLVGPCPRLFQLMVTTDGELHLHALNDGIVSDEVPLCGLGVGEYVVGSDVEKVKAGHVVHNLTQHTFFNLS